MFKETAETLLIVVPVGPTYSVTPLHAGSSRGGGKLLLIHKMRG
jgi:hypothetical protein